VAAPAIAFQLIYNVSNKLIVAWVSAGEHTGGAVTIVWVANATVHRALQWQLCVLME